MWKKFSCGLLSGCPYIKDVVRTARLVFSVFVLVKPAVWYAWSVIWCQSWNTQAAAALHAGSKRCSIKLQWKLSRRSAGGTRWQNRGLPPSVLMVLLLFWQVSLSYKVFVKLQKLFDLCIWINTFQIQALSAILPILVNIADINTNTNIFRKCGRCDMNLSIVIGFLYVSFFLIAW